MVESRGSGGAKSMATTLVPQSSTAVVSCRLMTVASMVSAGWNAGLSGAYAASINA